MPRQREAKVFFPWEQRRGLRGVFARARGRQALFARARARQVLLVGGALGAFLLLRAHERQTARVRATRAEITTAMGAIAAWRADHDRACPPAMTDLVAGGYLHAVPRDAWGRPLRVTCPGRLDPAGFDVTSDGPDGQPWGTDRVE